MTWSERRVVTFLTAVLGILLLALLVVLGIKYRENRDVEETAPVIAVADAGTSCTALHYYNGTATLDFLRNDKNKWVWAADDDFPLDESYITALLDTISAMTPIYTYETAESLGELTLEDLGLDSPSASISAEYSSGITFALSFGYLTGDESGVYALQTGQTAPVYVYPKAILDMMALGVYDMCMLPSFPELPEENIQRITIQGCANESGVLPRFTMDASRNGEKIVWKSDDKTITSFQRVRNLFTALSELKFTKCVSYRPSDEAAALCGLSPANATIWINYKTSTDLEEHFQMVIGNLTLDGQNRYVRINGEKDIYSVSSELLDTILVISQQGF